MKNTRLFDGISVPQLTPFHEDGTVNYREYARLTQWLLGQGVKGIFVCGTTGEFVNMTLSERKGLLEAAVEGAGGQGSILYNTTALNLTDAKALAEHAKKCGADAVSITPPFYHNYDSAALTNYFITLAQMADPLPVYLYNIPGMAKNVITPEIVRGVCEKCENVRGLKDSSMDFMTFLQFQTVLPDPEFELLTGNDAQVLTALQAGGRGAVIAMANVFPAMCVSIVDHFNAGELEKAREAQLKVMRLRDLVRSIMPIISHKEMMKLNGFEMGPSRFPFRGLTEKEVQTIHEQVAEITGISFNV